MLMRLVGLLIALASSTTAQGEAVYWNYGVASVTVGYSASRRPVGYKISFVGIGPDGASRPLAACIRRATIAAGEFTQDPLDDDIDDAPAVAQRLIRSNTSLTSETLRIALGAERDKTALMIARAEALFHRSVAGCAGQAFADQTALGMVNRLCVSWSPEPCLNLRAPVGRAIDRRTTRYSKVFDWLVASGAAPPLNTIVQLVPNGGAPRIIQPDLMDRAYLEAPSADEAQRQFEDGVTRLRDLGRQYDYVVPRVLSLDRGVTLRVIDVVDHPAFVIPLLQDQGRTLLHISDEIARTRLRECVLFLGQRTDAAASNCSGYDLRAGEIAACLGGDHCTPGFGDAARLSALLLNEPQRSLSALARGSTLPRLLGDGSLDDYSEAARACVARVQGDTATNNCVLESTLGGSDLALLQCINGGGYQRASSCVSGLLPRTAEARLARCMFEQTRDDARLLCAAAESSPEAATALACYQQHAGNARATALCIAESELPPSARESLACATQHPGDYKAIGACLIAARVGGDGGRLAGCAIASGGDFVGTAACAAGGSLTPEQQILLQCASQSPDTASFALCTGGQLSLREFAKCREASFGEGECFGESNSFRVFSRRLGLGDIHHDTAVGQAATIQVDLLVFQFRLAEAVLADTSRFLENAGQSAQDFVSAVNDVVEGIAEGAGNVVEQACQFVGFCRGAGLTVDIRPLGEVRAQTGTARIDLDPAMVERDSTGTGRRTLETARPEDWNRIARPVLLPPVPR